jgi:hypothetical protein
MESDVTRAARALNYHGVDGPLTDSRYGQASPTGGYQMARALIEVVALTLFCGSILIWMIIFGFG